MVGKGIAAGAVWLGRTIVLVGKAILPELLATLGGAAGRTSSSLSFEAPNTSGIGLPTGAES